jgi:hypothetical protein
LKERGWSFAIYSYNFGNFRNELNDTRLIPLLESFSDFGIDLFMYTDNPAALSELLGWKVIYHPVPPMHNTIPGRRVASKALKWTPPTELLSYTYLIHTDLSHHTLAILNRWLHYGWLIKEILRQPNISLFIRHHELRTQTKGEYAAIKHIGARMQDKARLAEWNTFLNSTGMWPAVNAMPLPWTNLFVRKVQDGLTNCLRHIYEVTMQHGIWRDQLVL